MKEKKINKEVKSKRIIFGIIIGVIILSAIAFAALKYVVLPQKSESLGNVTDIVERDGEIVAYKYNNYQFEKNNNMWITEIQQGKQPYIIAFTYGPINVENISLQFKPNYFQSMTKPGRKVYLSFDHNSTDASYIATSMINLITNLGTVYSVSAQRACLTNLSSCAGAPIITCENTLNSAVIQFKESIVPYAVYEENCLTVYGSKDDFIRTSEKIILNWYKIA